MLGGNISSGGPSASTGAGRGLRSEVVLAGWLMAERAVGDQKGHCIQREQGFYYRKNTGCANPMDRATCCAANEVLTGMLEKITRLPGFKAEFSGLKNLVFFSSQAHC